MGPGLYKCLVGPTPADQARDPTAGACKVGKCSRAGRIAAAEPDVVVEDAAIVAPAVKRLARWVSTEELYRTFDVRSNVERRCSELTDTPSLVRHREVQRTLRGVPMK
jgi:hypothetical protein